MATPENDAIVQDVLTMRATVWQRTANTGPYNNAVKTGLACRLDTVNLQSARSSVERADLASLRTFMFDATYTLPEQGTQIEITSPAYYAGQKWNIKAGTVKPSILPGGSEPIAVECDVVRAS